MRILKSPDESVFLTLSGAETDAAPAIIPETAETADMAIMETTGTEITATAMEAETEAGSPVRISL